MISKEIKRSVKFATSPLTLFLTSWGTRSTTFDRTWEGVVCGSSIPKEHRMLGCCHGMVSANLWNISISVWFRYSVIVPWFPIHPHGNNTIERDLIKQQFNGSKVGDETALVKYLLVTFSCLYGTTLHWGGKHKSITEVVASKEVDMTPFKNPAFFFFVFLFDCIQNCHRTQITLQTAPRFVSNNTVPMHAGGLQVPGPHGAGSLQVPGPHGAGGLQVPGPHCAGAAAPASRATGGHTWKTSFLCCWWFWPRDLWPPLGHTHTHMHTHAHTHTHHEFVVLLRVSQLHSLNQTSL